MRTDSTAAHVYLVLSRAHRAVEARALQSIAGLGLGATDFAVLEALLHRGPLPVNVIGRKVLLTSGSISVAVDRLVRRGLVERRDDAEDRRVRLVALTPDGRGLIEAAFARHAADLEDAMAALTAGERTALARLLRKLGRGAERGSGHEQHERENAS